MKKLMQWAIVAISTVVMAPADAIARPLNEIQEVAQSTTVLIDGLHPGSGVIVAQDRSHYWVLTAQHVVATEDEYWIVTPDGAEYPLNYDSRQLFPGQDLALVSFRSRRPYQIATLADYPRLEGSFPPVFVSGWQGSNINQQPLQHRLEGGQLLSRQYGLIHAKNPLARGYGLFYTSVTEQGMSGGPILDTEGQVIGIHGRSEGEEINSSGGLSRLHWGFSSGLPLPDDLPTRLTPPVRWKVQTQPPLLPSASDMASYQAVLQAAQEQPMDVVGWINLGNQLYRQEQFTQALNAFETALEQQPDLYQAWYGKAQVLSTLGDYDSAIKAYNQVLALQPKFAQALRDRALVWILSNQPQQAISDLDQAVNADPGDYVAWYLRGNVFWKYRDWHEAALGSYDRALSIEPDFAEVWIERGRVLHTLNRGSEAIASLQTATRLAPDLVDSWYWLATILHEQGYSAAALEAVKSGLAIAPDGWNTLLLEAQILINLQQSAVARRRLRYIMQYAPADSSQVHTASQILQRL